MKTSGYLEQILFKEQSPVADQLFEERSEGLFLVDSEKSFVNFHSQEQHPAVLLPKSHADKSSERDTREELYDVELISRCASEPSSSEPPSPADSSRLLVQRPPRYVAEEGLHLRRIHDPQELSRLAADSNGRFRLCFIERTHSYSRLLISRELFETLLLEFGVFSRFREFALLFGLKQKETEISPPQLRFRLITSNDLYTKKSTGISFECAYALRYVELNHRETRKPWSLRQTAVYHRYDSKSDASTWILISASEKSKTCLDRYSKSFKHVEATNPFDIHILLLETAMVNWRPFIVDLTERINEQSDKILVASIDEKDPIQIVDVGDRQSLKDLEDEILDTILVFDSLSGYINSLLKNYNNYCLVSGFESEDNELDCIRDALLEKLEDVMLSRQRVQTLHMKIKGTIRLLSDLLNLGNGFSLKHLAEEAKVDNVIMRRLAEKTTQDAAAVKVLTIITLIYLPATVVSNFFSSQFVTTQTQDNKSTVELTSNAWVFAAVSTPLTVLTIMIWWAWIRFQANIAKRKGNIGITPLNTVYTAQPKFEKPSNQES